MYITHYGLAIYIKKSILRQIKKNYEKSNYISPCKKYNLLKKNPLNKTKILQYIIIIIITLF
jgi:hypothetical protein